MSAGWHSKDLQILSSIENLTETTRLFFKLERLAIDTPVFPKVPSTSFLFYLKRHRDLSLLNA